jgi:NhaA family Na+:H+ antiporter
MIAAQLVGRPAGMVLAVGLAVAAGLHLPHRMGWRELLVVALATSSGFAISLFFATGLLAPGAILTQVKVGLIAASGGAVLAFAAARLLRVGRFT